MRKIILAILLLVNASAWGQSGSVAGNGGQGPSGNQTGGGGGSGCTTLTACPGGAGPVAVPSLASTGPASASALNMTATNGLQLNAASIINIPNQSFALGSGAGVALSPNDIGTVAFGVNALNLYAKVQGENTAIGWGSMRLMTGGMVYLPTTLLTSTNTLTFASTNISDAGLLANGYFAVAAGIADGVTVSSVTNTTIVLSATVSVASGVNVYFAQHQATTTAATTGGNALTLNSVTGLVVGNVVINSATGSGIVGVVEITNITGLVVTLSQNVTVGSGAIVYFANATAQANTATGLNTLGQSYQDSGNTVLGNDVMRDSFGSINTAVGKSNMRDGYHSMNAVFGNGALQSDATINAGAANSITRQNTVIGTSAMGGSANTTPANNTVGGYRTFFAATSGSNNAFWGYQMAQAATTASSNTGIGSQTFTALTTGGSNVAVGFDVLSALTTASFNVAVGRFSQLLNVTANFQVSVGDSTMSAWVGTSNNANNANVAIGASAGSGATGTTYTSSTFVGANAGKATAGAAANATYLGTNAGLLATAGANTIVGANVASVTLTSGVGNIYIGPGQATGTSAIDAATGSESNTFRLGGNAVNLMRGTGINTSTPILFLDWIPASTTFANDAAAATGGVAVGQMYRNGSVLQIRISQLFNEQGSMAA